jgi:PAS domain S-box-containing protein
MGKLKASFQNNEHLQMFRRKAEALIKNNRLTSDYEISNPDTRELIHELQVFQIELEMQNDELILSHEHLEIEKNKFAGLYDLAPVGYFILDKFGAVDEVNRTGLNMLQVEKPQILSRRFQDYVQMHETDVFYNFIRKMRTLNTRHSCQLRVVSSKGKTYYAQLEGTGIVNKISGDIQFYIAVIDVTNRRQAEQHLQASTERLRMTLEASSTGTWEIDLARQHIFMDDNCYALFGFSPWEFDGKYDTFFKLIHPEERESFRNLLKHAINDGKELDTEFRVILEPTGLRHMAIRGQTIRQDPDQMRFVGIIIDVTEKKRLQEEAETLRLNYQRTITAAGLIAQEKERKRISEALHDSVAQLLYGIRLNLQSYTRTNPVTEQLKNINTLLDQSIAETRSISFELAPSILVDFGLVESVNEMARRLTTPNFSIQVKSSGSKRLNPDMEISAFRIIQELVNNAIKHGNATEANIKISMTTDAVTITVSDNGSGLKVKESDYLLRGSGLRSIKNRVNLFNGSLNIKGGAGKGTSVAVTLKIEE